MPLSPGAHAFTTRLAAQTGLNPSVIAGWVMAETSGHDTTNGPNNWLNVGSFDSGFSGGGANIWQNPITAADGTAAFLRGRPVNGIKPPLGGGAPSVRGILSTVGKGPGAQVQAIQNSGWASSHYNGNLMADVRPFLGQNWQIGSPPPSGTSAMAPGTRVQGAQPVGLPPQTVTSSHISKASIAGQFLANEPSVNPWNLPIPGSRQSSGTDQGVMNPLVASGRLPAQLQTVTTTKVLPNANAAHKAQNALQGLAGGAPLKVHPAALSDGADIHPLGSGWTLTELDQGVDASARVGAPIRAINDSRLVSIQPGWYSGQPFATFQLLSGPNKGKYWYVAEQVDNLPKVGTVVRRGGVVGRYAASGTGIEIGWAGGAPGQTLTAKVDPGAVANRHAVGTPQGRAFLHRIIGAQSTLGGS